MKTTDIKSIHYNNNEVVALYRGNILIYSKQSDETPYNPKLLKGKFADDTGDYSCKINGYYVSLYDYVDSETREFEYEYDGVMFSLSFYIDDDTPNHIERIDSFPDISNVVNLNSLFFDCHELQYVNFGKHFNTENVKNMGSMFGGCSSLQSLDLSSFNTKNVQVMSSMFDGCSSLQSLDLSSFNTENVQIMSYMFEDCNKLKSLNLGNNFNLSSVTSITNPFWSCDSLTTVTGTISGIKVNLNINHSPLTNESAMVFINGLENVSSTKTLSLKSTTYDTLTEEQIAMATSKGWSVIRG